MKKFIGSVFLLAICLLGTSSVFAWDRGHRLPWGTHRVVHHGENYFFVRGSYYRYSGREYVLVRPPVGVIIEELPRECRTIYVGNQPRYVYQNVTYAQVPQGYQVVQTTPAPATPAPTIQNTHDDEESKLPKEYEIYIPNKNGSYTLVVIKKADKGFIGPQGEYYKEHPTVEQLKAMYAKS